MYKLYIEVEDEYLDHVSTGEVRINSGEDCKYLTVDLVNRLVREWIYNFYTEQDICSSHVYTSDLFKISDQDFEHLLLDNGQIRLSGRCLSFTFIVELFPMEDG